MKRFGTTLRLTLCLSLLTVIALSFPEVSMPAAGNNPLSVDVVNTPLPVQGTVNGAVSITGTPNVNVVNTPAVNVTNSLNPSQLVTLFPSDLCPNGLGNAFTTQHTADGLSAQFVIPSGKVLVISDAGIEARGSAGDTVEVALLRVSPTGSSNLIDLGFTTLNHTGSTTLRFHFPTGASVKAGLTICQRVFNSSTGFINGSFSTLHGYLADDR